MQKTQSRVSAAHHDLIDIHKPAHLTYWAERLRVTRQKIVQAVDAVGPKVRDVMGYFTRSR